MRNEDEGRRNKREFWTSRALVLCACGLLVYSFVVTSDVSATVSTRRIEDEITHPTPRLVFMVIDAFRLSFLTAPDSPMTFVRSSINSSSAVVFDAYARMPTVTLPRITAYITGTLPSFGTILTNLATNEIKTDNWISRLNSNAKKVHFFGDDTWIKLLPGQFAKSEGVTSFFVNDYTEVDNNVTRHLDEELSSEKWDALILHYLGLDHVGHSLGGTSPKIREKLVEMDQIVRRIHDELSNISRETHLIVCGDHGMTAAGSHGGASPDETRVPVVIWKINDKGERLKNDVSGLTKPEEIEQIDISSTIFDLFGMSMPSESYGISLAGSLQGDSPMTMKKQYDHFEKLIKDKKLLTSEICGGKDCDLSSEFMRSTLKKWFREVQRELIGTASQVPNSSLAVCVIILVLAATLSTFSWISESDWSDFALLTVNVTCFASSLIEEEHEIWYFLVSTMIALRIGRNLLEWRKGRRSEIESSILLAFLCRLASGFTQNTRRRWSMDQSLLPPAIFPESLDISVEDLNTYIGRYQLPVVVISAVFYQYFFRNSHLLIALPFASHLIRFLGYVRLDAYFLGCFRLLLLPIFVYSSSISTCIISLLLTIVPSSQLLLVLIIYQIGAISSKLNISKLEAVFLSMASFYYTGNSNSLSTLSLTAGYVGLLDYYPILVGFQLFLYTFAGPISFLCGRNSTGKRDSPVSLAFTFRISCLATSLICLYIFQHHLFVWSVYTPKVVYDMAHVIFYLIAGIPFQ